MMDDTDTPVLTDKLRRRPTKSAGRIIRGILDGERDMSDLAAHFRSGGQINAMHFELLGELLSRSQLKKNNGGQRGPRLPDDPKLRNIALARHCAAYIVRCCVDIYKAGRNPPLAQTVLNGFETEALKIVFDFIHVAHGDRHAVSYIVKSERGKNPLFTKPLHDTICRMVHSKMNAKLVRLLDRLEAKYSG